jgi:general secretion pathway protein J
MNLYAMTLSTIRKRQADYGFTLIEVMLAMAITGFVGLLAYSGLNTSMIAAEEHEQQASRIAAIQLPLTVIERDVRHAVARPITDEYGDREPPMLGGALNDYPLILTRRDWDNPRQLPRSELQRVRYVLENNKLWRQSWAVLDRISEEEGQQNTLLLEGVENLQLAFLDGNSSNAAQSSLGGEWVDDWDDDTRLPLALEIKLELENFGEVKRVFSIPSP